MADPFIGQIAIFGFNFAPRGWAMCHGQLMPISQNFSLFSVIGTNYGGDGKSTFALPNLQGSAVIGAGQGPALSQYFSGDTGGSPTAMLNNSEMPQHRHGFAASIDQAAAAEPAGNLLARATRPFAGGAEAQAAEAEVQAPAPTEIQANFYSANPADARTALARNAIAPVGGNQPHNNMQPYLALNFCIALQGTMPVRSH